MESSLQSKEISQSISIRWTTDSPEYIDTKAVATSRQKQELRGKINKDARERWFLLRLKSKYAG